MKGPFSEKQRKKKTDEEIGVDGMHSGIVVFKVSALEKHKLFSGFHWKGFHEILYIF
jgi:hypothetical protein